MMKKTDKGDYGYLQKNKILQLTVSLILMLIILAMFYTGYIKYHDTKNIFTVFSVVSVIPAAKFIVSYIVMAPYKSITEDLHARISVYKNVNILYDLLISSSEKVINVKIAAIRDNSLFLYVPDKKYSKSDVEKYIKSIIESECKSSVIKMYSDFDNYEKNVAVLDKNEHGKYDKRIAQLLKTFSM